VTAVLLLSCPDQPGVVAATAQFLADHHGNIVHAEQHVDPGTGNGDAMFFQRVEFDLDGFGLDRDEIVREFAPTADRLGMTVELRFSDVPTPTALMASKQPHCLYDLLTRWRSGELPMDLRVVVSNHPDHAGIAEHMGVPYLHFPVTPDTKAEQEARVLAALDEHDVELIVMARYMQILSDRFVSAHPSRIINIHHSFLPAFIGANPYRQAHDRGSSSSAPPPTTPRQTSTRDRSSNRTPLTSPTATTSPG
jgi:formyltetrahydrofolate deformylase